MKRTVLEGLRTWSIHQPERKIDFNGFFWKRPGGNVLIDPMPMTEDDIGEVAEEGGVRWILLSNADHLRWAPRARERFGARVLAPTAERERFGAASEFVDVWYEGAAQFPGDLAADVAVWPVRGGKSPVEPAFHLLSLKALYFGDVVRSHVSGALCLLPAAKLSDPRAVLESLRPLLEFDFAAVLLGDGDSIYRGGREAFAQLWAV